MGHFPELGFDGPIQDRVPVTVHRDPEGGDPVQIGAAADVFQRGPSGGIDDQRLFLHPFGLLSERMPDILPIPSDQPISLRRTFHNGPFLFKKRVPILSFLFSGDIVLAFFVEIFDAGGARIFEAVNDGASEIVWDGKDKQGNTTESGVYLARITDSSGASHFQTIAVVK
jgi:hypothetical protein